MRKFFNKVVNGVSENAGPIEDPDRTEDVVFVKHGKNEHEFKFPLGAISSGTVTVGALRAKASQVTEVEPSRISLVGLGRNLKDDATTLRSLGMGSGSKILCMASQVKAQSTKTAAKPAPVPVQALTPMEMIESVLQAVNEKTGTLTEEFLKNPPKEFGVREQQHRMIAETVMGELLKLDSIESDDPDVRKRRKEVVKEIQRRLESIDKVLKENPT